MEVTNTQQVHDLLPQLDPYLALDFRRAHGELMHNLSMDAGTYRTGPVEVVYGDHPAHGGRSASADNLASGIASAAFIAYLSGLTNVSYSATQYALFSSMMLLLPKFIAGFSGDFVNAHGYANFFTATALLGLPVLVMVWLASRVLPVQKKA